MPKLIFEHEKVNNGNPLVVHTGADEVKWGYKLNIARKQTYGGEVVQILSCYIDDLEIEGMVRAYKTTEKIYRFFMEYFVKATQGPVANATAESKFEQTPMVFIYPE